MEKSLWKEVVGAVAVILAAVVVGAFFFARHQSQPTAPKPAPVHYHAGFRIYVDDTLQSYSDMQFMEIAPCTPSEVPEDATVHLHNGVGDVVHVHKAGMTWQNLFHYLNSRAPGTLPDGARLSELGIRGYINGQLVENILAAPIVAYDSAVIIIGTDTGDLSKKLRSAVTVDDIKKAEASKENCGL